MLNIISPRNVESRHRENTAEIMNITNLCRHWKINSMNFWISLMNYCTITEFMLRHLTSFGRNHVFRGVEKRAFSDRLSEWNQQANWKPDNSRTQQLGHRPRRKLKNILFNKRDSLKFILSCCLPMSCSHFFPFSIVNENNAEWMTPLRKHKTETGVVLK